MRRNLRQSEVATRGVRRLLLGQLDAGLRRLAVRRLDDTTVHDLRRDLKRGRAYLRLLRPTLGQTSWHRLDEAAAAVTRPLGPLRDRRVLKDAVQDLSSHGTDPVFDRFASTLQREAEHDGADGRRARLARDAHRRLVRLRVMLRGGRIEPANWSVIGAGLHRTYRAARRAWHEASETGRDLALHRWRRHTKSLRYQLQLLEPIHPQCARLGARLDEVGEILGRHHDLMVLRDHVQASASLASDPEGGARFLAILDDTLAVLGTEALAEGRTLFKDRPKDFTRRLHRHWRAWHHAAPRSAQPSNDSLR
jgi:CHAD domain-containing protein